MAKKLVCCICNKVITPQTDNHNPYPVRPYSEYGDRENRCCSVCNQLYVIPYRRFTFNPGDIEIIHTFTEEQIQANLDYNLGKLNNMK